MLITAVPNRRRRSWLISSDICLSVLQIDVVRVAVKRCACCARRFFSPSCVRVHLASSRRHWMLRECQQSSERAYQIALMSTLLATLLALAAVGTFMLLLRRHLTAQVMAAAV